MKEMTQIIIRDKQFYRTMIAFALPIALQSCITVGVNMADNVMLGQLGEQSMNSATLANNFLNIYQIMSMGIGMGASVLTSRYFGMKDRNSMKKAVNIMFRMELIFASLFALVTLLVPARIMQIFTPEADVISGGVGYLLISIPCFYLNGYALTSSLLLRSVGKANIPLISSIGAFFTNIFFNWLLIFGNLGAPRMGVNGAALGTLLSRILEFSVTMGYLFFFDRNIGFRISDLRMKVKDLIPEYVRICVPVMVSDALLAFGNSATVAIMGHIGRSFVAANAITATTMQLATVFISGMSQASCNMTGITLGEGEIKKAQRQGWTFAALGLLLGAAGSLLIFLLKDQIIGLYKIEPETKVLAGHLMNALAITISFQCGNSMLAKGTLRGGGDVKFLMVFDVLFLWMVSIPLGSMAGLVWKWDGFWVYLALRSDQILKLFICLWRLMSGKWIKKIKAV